MGTAFWKNPTFWTMFFVILIVVLIPLFFYFFKNPILSLITPNLSGKTQSPATTTAKPGSCFILEEKYCSKGQLIDIKNSSGQPETYIGFHIPANEPFFAGKDGQALKAKIGQPSALQGLLATIRDPNLGDPNATAYDVIGALRFDNMSTVNVKKGDIVGYTQDTGIKNFGDYNLLVTIRRLDPESKKTLTDKQMLYELFPSIKQ